MMSENSKVPLRLNMWLAVGGMVGSSLFIPVSFFIGETTEGYSHLSQGISALSEAGAPAAWLQTSNFIVVGLLLIGMAVGLQKGIAKGKGPWAGPALISAFGVLALIANGVFPADPVGAPETTMGTVHSLTAGFGFIAVIVAMFLMPRRFRKQEEWKSLASPSKWFGLASIILMLSYLFAQEGVIERWQPWTGLLQRGMGGVVLIWLFILAYRLYQASRQSMGDDLQG